MGYHSSTYAGNIDKIAHSCYFILNQKLNNVKKQKQYLFIYAYDTQKDGTELGPGTIQRIDAGLKFILDSDDTDWVIILGAGMDPNKSKRLRPLSYLMRWYIVDYLVTQKFFDRLQGESWTSGVYTISIVQATRDAWGSWGETLAGLHDVQIPKNHPVHVSTSRFHMPRIQLLWLLLGYVIIPIKSEWKAARKEVIFEPVKMLKVMLLGMWNWIKTGH